MSGLLTFRHPRTGLSIGLPGDWDMQVDPQPSVALVVVEPRTDDSFRANLVVTTDELPDGLDLRLWQEGTDELLPQALHEYVLLDLEDVELAGLPARRRLAHHTVESGAAVTMQQWAAVRGREGVTVTTTVETMELASTAAMFAAVVDTLVLGPDAAGSPR